MQGGGRRRAGELLAFAAREGGAVLLAFLELGGREFDKFLRFSDPRRRRPVSRPQSSELHMLETWIDVASDHVHWSGPKGPREAYQLAATAIARELLAGASSSSRLYEDGLKASAVPFKRRSRVYLRLQERRWRLEPDSFAKAGVVSNCSTAPDSRHTFSASALCR